MKISKRTRKRRLPVKKFKLLFIYYTRTKHNKNISFPIKIFHLFYCDANVISWLIFECLSFGSSKLDLVIGLFNVALNVPLSTECANCGLS